MANQFDNLFFDPAEHANIKVPYVDGCHTLINGELKPWTGKSIPVHSPIRRKASALKDGSDAIELGKYAMCDKECALDALNAAKEAYDYGRGSWPQLKPVDRIKAVKKFADAMASKREELVNILMFEICKNRADSEKEVDRTVKYIYDTINELTKMENGSNGVKIDSSIISQTKRAPLGIALVAGPFNYPLNEFCTLFIPAIIMGNTVVIKTPRTGGLVHIPLLDAYQNCFPAGAVNVVHGSGREVFTPIMNHGAVNILAFIGTNTAAQSLHSAHPKPFSVRLALGLDAKNPAIVTSDADLDVASTEITLGSLSYNGQRCTAIKITFVHESVADALVGKLTDKIKALKMGLPWGDGVKITPVAETNKPEYLRQVIADAEKKGAKCLTGNQFDRSFCAPTLLYPCSLDMTVCQEEQFGPVVPIVKYKEFREVEEYISKTLYGQQASVFTSNAGEIPHVVDFLAHHVTRININSQCQRGPDSMPFSGRKVSAAGTLSLWDALRTMSIRVAVAAKQTELNAKIFTQTFEGHKSNTLSSDVIISKI